MLQEVERRPPTPLTEDIESIKMSAAVSDEDVHVDHHRHRDDTNIVENGCNSGDSGISDTLTNGGGSEHSSSPEPQTNHSAGDTQNKRAPKLSNSDTSETINGSKVPVIVKDNYVHSNSHTESTVESDLNCNNNTVNQNRSVEIDTIDSTDSNYMCSDDVEISTPTVSHNSQPVDDMCHVTSSVQSPTMPTTTLLPTMPTDYLTTSSPLSNADGHMTFTITASSQGQMTSLQQCPTMPTGMSIPTFTPMANRAFDPRTLQGPPTGMCSPGAPPLASSTHPHSSSPTTPPLSGTTTPSPNTCPPGPGGTAAPGHQHVVHVHINPGETFTIRMEDQLQHIQGKSIIIDLAPRL